MRVISTVSMLGYLAAGCTSGGFGGGSGKAQKTDKSEDSDETIEEDDQGDAPVEVAGAFLTFCGEAPENPGAEGEVGLGCRVVDKDTGAKTKKPVAHMKVNLSFADGAKETVDLTEAPADSQWHGFFHLSQAKYDQWSGYDLEAEIDGVQSTIEQTPEENKAPPNDLPYSKFHLAFTTAREYLPGEGGDVSFNGLGGADRACQQSAAAVGWGGGKWYALLYLDGNVLDQFVVSKPLRSATNESFTVPLLEFELGGGNAFSFDENGQAIDDSEPVWTGLSDPNEPYDCERWGVNTQDHVGSVGNPKAGGEWQWRAESNCSEPARLYCISE